MLEFYAGGNNYLDELSEKLILQEGLRDKIVELSGDYTVSRYPDVSDLVPFEMYTESIAKDKVEIAKDVFQTVLQLYPDLEILGEG